MGLLLLTLAAWVFISSAMVATLWLFFRHLRRIEREYWGDHPDTESLRYAWQRWREQRRATRGRPRKAPKASAHRSPSESTSPDLKP